MTPAPLPPHERAWRHPSEMGRAEHAPARGRSHLLIASTAAAGMILAAFLVVGMTPTSRSTEVASPGPTGPFGVDRLTTVALSTSAVDTVASVAASFVTGESAADIATTVPLPSAPATVDDTTYEPVPTGEALSVRLPTGQAVEMVIVAIGAGGMVVVSMALGALMPDPDAEPPATTEPTPATAPGTVTGTSEPAVTDPTSPTGSPGTTVDPAPSTVPPADASAPTEVCDEHDRGETGRVVTESRRDAASAGEC